jgi:uncharacterized delta-60 repeat protein
MKQQFKNPARFSFLKITGIISFSIIFISLSLAGAKIYGQSAENLPGVDPTFAPKISKGGSVGKTILQPDGKIILIGAFNEAGGFEKTNIVRVNADGTIDNSFNFQSPNVAVGTLELLPDGKLIGFGETLVRFNQDGSVDPGFNFAREIRSSGEVKLKPRSDGKVFLYGDFKVRKQNLLVAEKFIQVDQTGGIESGFRPDISGRIMDVFPQANGKTILTGNFDLKKAGQLVNRNFAVLDENGSPDSSFGGFYGTQSQQVNGVIVQPDAKLVLYGNFSEAYKQLQTGRLVKNRGLLRLNADGSFDRDFAVPFAQETNISSAHLQPDGKIVFSGLYNLGGGAIYRSPARVFADGSFDASYSNNLPYLAGFTHTIRKMEMQPDGRLLLAGKFRVNNSPDPQKLIKLNADGSLDQTFETPAITGGDVVNFNVLPGGNVFIGGNFGKIGNRTRVGAARLNLNGLLDENFRCDIFNDEYVQVTALALQTDGKYLIAGEFSVINGEYIQSHATPNFPYFNEHTFNAVARLNADGSLDNAFAPLTNVFEKIFRLIVQADGKILIGGQLIQNDFTNNVVRLNADGTLDGDFTRLRIVGPSGNANSVIYDMTVSPADGKIIIAGYFGYVDGVRRNKIARLNADGSLDYSFDYPNFDLDTDIPQKIVLQPDGKIIAGGPISAYRSPGLPRFNRNGTLDAAFKWNQIRVATQTAAMELLPDGKILFSGQIGGFGYEVFHPRGLARLNQSGEVEFRYNVAAEKFLRQTDGKIVLFNSLYPAPGFALTRIFADGGADDAFRFTLDKPLSELVRQPDGKIVLAGRFTNIDGVRRFSLARLNP